MDQGLYYILLKETTGEGRWWNYTKRTTLPGGEILYLTHELEQPKDPENIALTRHRWSNIALIDRWFDITVKCPKLDVSLLTDSEADLLDAVASREERLRIYRDKKRLTESKTLDTGCTVFVKMRKENIDLELLGVIRWKGKLSIGARFGVELIGKESEGCGDNDGRYPYGRRYFTCPANQGVFVTVDKLRLRRDQDQEECIGQISDGRVAKLAAYIRKKLYKRGEIERRHRHDSSEQGLHELELSLAAESNANEETQRRLRSNEQRSHELESSLAAERKTHEETKRRLRGSIG